MLFNSFSFAIFFPTVVILYYVLPKNFKKLFLLLASCFFYMAFVPKYIVILFALITIDFILAKTIDKQVGSYRKLMLSISIVANLGTLIFFRYFNFLNTNIAELAHLLHWNYAPSLLTIALPLGLSFHVFQSLSYVIEVYNKRYPPERNYLTYALYVMFFPQLVAGPIERPQHLLPQLNQLHEFNAVLTRRGLERMLWGFFKKLVIADQLSQIINPLYGNLPKDGMLLVAIAILFAYQLYCDFSGYSDIAIGSAMVLGYNLTENFNRPFASRSFAEFWRRWHMSLSNWLRDYLYYPLALTWAKGSKTKLFISLLLTFVLIGLWHGANWTFAVFGTLNGSYLILEALTGKYLERIAKLFRLAKHESLYQAVQTLIVFLGMNISFIFFRSETVTQGWWYIKNIIFINNFHFDILYVLRILPEHVGRIVFYETLVAIVVLEAVQLIQARKNTFHIFENSLKPIRYGWYYFLVGVIISFGYFGAQTFIYFQF